MSNANGTSDGFAQLIGEHSLIQKITHLTRKVAVTEATILIMGESGGVRVAGRRRSSD